MAYKILLTSLYEADKNGNLHYFYAKDGGRNYYCDAMTTVELFFGLSAVASLVLTIYFGMRR